MSSSLLIIGCGDLGNHLGSLMAEQNWQVYGMRRNVSEIAPNIHRIFADLYQKERPINWPTTKIDYIIFCAAPSANERSQYQELYYQGLQNVLQWIENSQQYPKKLLIISSTAVYAQNDGSWVDEKSSTDPENLQGKTMLAMEQLAKNSSIDTTIIRLSGIYGPTRYYLIKQAIQGITYPQTPLLYANRIHIEDAALLLQAIIYFHKQGNELFPCYIGVDDEPAPIQETLAWIRNELAINTLTTQHAERRTGSKRLTNKLAKTTGWIPKYKNYKDGYKEILAQYKKGQ